MVCARLSDVLHVTARGAVRKRGTCLRCCSSTIICNHPTHPSHSLQPHTAAPTADMTAACAAAAAPGRPVVRLLRLAGVPILQQLQLEEALLRATPYNWFIINDGTSQPSIVMGVSG